MRNSPLDRTDPLGLDDCGDGGDCGGGGDDGWDWGCAWGCDGGGGGVTISINWGPRGVNVGLVRFGGCQGESLGVPCGGALQDPFATKVNLARQAIVAAVKGNWLALLALGTPIGTSEPNGCDFGVCAPTQENVVGVDDAVEVYEVGQGLFWLFTIGRELWEIHAGKRDLKVFKDAWKEVQRICGRTLNDDQWRQLHDLITKQGVGDYWDIVQEGVTLFCPDKRVPH